MSSSPALPCPDMDDGQPPATMDDGQPPATNGVEICDSTNVREPEPAPNTGPAIVAPALGAPKEPGTADGTLALPDEVLMAVFNFCDARTQMMAIPAVSKRWLGVCQMRRAAIDLTWARTVHGRRCAITDVGLAGLVRRFPKLWRLDLSWCKNVTDGGLTAVAAGCPNLQHLGLEGCENVTDSGLVAVAAGCPNIQHLELYCENVTDGGAALFPNANVTR